MRSSLVAPPMVEAWRRDRRFFSSMAVAAALVVFLGFAPTYFLKAWFGTPPLPYGNLASKCKAQNLGS